jgi:multiple sugar transport system ATP-binding protein
LAEIVYSGVIKAFPGGTIAVDRLELEIHDGEFLVLVGPSGSGKTTVLRMTAGLDEPTQGEIHIGDQLVNGLPPRDRDIAMVFQNYALYPHMTVYENMAFGLKLHGLKKAAIKPRVQSAAAMLGIGELLARKPGQLSGGQRQRVAMGRAIVREPAAFLMDEPLSNLDAKLRVEMRSYISTLHQRLRTTTLYVTHDQTEAMTMGDRVAVMRDGRLVQVDSPKALYERPADMFVAEFIGSPAMNLLRSRLTAVNGSVLARFGSEELHLPPTVLARWTRLRDFVGRDVVLGLRPEDVEDARHVPPERVVHTLQAVPSLAEPLGSEVVVHFPIDAEPLARGKEDPSRELELAEPGRADVTARLSPLTRAAPREPVTLAVDLDRLHFFDPETESAIA